MFDDHIIILRMASVCNDISFNTQLDITMMTLSKSIYELAKEVYTLKKAIVENNSPATPPRKTYHDLTQDLHLTRSDPRFIELLLPIPNLKPLRNEPERLKSEIKKWLGKLCKEIFSLSFGLLK